MADILGIGMTEAEKAELGYLMSKDERLKRIFNSLSENEKRKVLRITLSEIRELKKIDKMV